MITSSPACEADNPERHHLAIWKHREDWLGDKGLHITPDFSLLFCMFESRVATMQYLAPGQKTQLMQRLSDQASECADELKKNLNI